MAVSAELDHSYEVVTGESRVNLTIVSVIKQFVQHTDHRQFNPNTIHQAKGYSEKIGLDFNKEPLLVDYYGVLRENRFPVPPGQEEAAHTVNKLGDQRQFALALLLSEKHTEFDRFVQQFPNIFDQAHFPAARISSSLIPK